MQGLTNVKIVKKRKMNGMRECKVQIVKCSVGSEERSTGSANVDCVQKSIRALVVFIVFMAGLKWVAGPKHTRCVLVFCGRKGNSNQSPDCRSSILSAPIYHDRLQED